jgi:hypothetical protein
MTYGFKPKLIGLAGYARVGKDTVAEILVEQGYAKHAFADSMRHALYTLNPNIDIYGHRVYLQPAVDSMGWEAVKEGSIEYRPLMQRLGTEVGRQLISDSVWIDQVFEGFTGLDVISDVRFANEADAIRAAGGVVWLITRSEIGPVNNHSSENSLDGYAFDAEIDNSTDLAALKGRIWQLLEGE